MSPVCWKMRKQGIVALSSSEAEYIALVHAVQEGLSLQKIFTDLYGKRMSTQVLILRYMWITKGQ